MELCYLWACKEAPIKTISYPAGAVGLLVESDRVTLWSIQALIKIKFRNWVGILFNSAICCKTDILMQDFSISKADFFHQIQLVIQ